MEYKINRCDSNDKTGHDSYVSLQVTQTTAIILRSRTRLGFGFRPRLGPTVFSRLALVPRFGIIVLGPRLGF